jgi:hypothetical protein
MFVGSFSDDFDRFQADVNSSVTQLQAAGATHLIIDLHNNGGRNSMCCLYQREPELHPQVDLSALVTSSTSSLQEPTFLCRM